MMTIHQQEQQEALPTLTEHRQDLCQATLSAHDTGGFEYEAWAHLTGERELLPRGPGRTASGSTRFTGRPLP